MSDAEEHVRIDFAVAGHDDLEAAQKAERRAVERATRELREENVRLWEAVRYVRIVVGIAGDCLACNRTLAYLDRSCPESEYQRRLAEAKSHEKP